MANYPWHVTYCGEGGNDTWGYPRGECTSGVCWFLNAWGIPFKPGWRGQWFGNADSWHASAQAAGLPVDRSPAVGSVLNIPPSAAWQDPVGHVAMVVSLSGGIHVQQLNWASPCQYGTYTFPSGDADQFYFLHFETIAPGAVVPPPVVVVTPPVKTTYTITSAPAGTNDGLIALALLAGVVGAGVLGFHEYAKGHPNSALVKHVRDDEHEAQAKVRSWVDSARHHVG